MRSTADLAIIPIQDYLVKGNEARMNCPASMGTNWQWRVIPHFLSDQLAESIFEMTKLYGRLPAPAEPASEDEDDADGEEPESGTTEKTGAVE